MLKPKKVRYIRSVVSYLDILGLSRDYKPGRQEKSRSKDGAGLAESVRRRYPIFKRLREILAERQRKSASPSR